MAGRGWTRQAGVEERKVRPWGSSGLTTLRRCKEMEEAVGAQRQECEGAAGWDCGMRGLFWLLLPYPGCCAQ